MYGLTQSQVQLYDFICREVAEKQVPPSYHEMMQEMGLKSKSGIHRLIQALKERGYIKTLPNRARAVVPIFAPETVASEGDAMGKIRDIAFAAHYGEIGSLTAINQILEIVKK